MSGEAGASLQSRLYSIWLGSGRIVSVALPPGNDGSAVGEYFERNSRPYRDWLERARPGLDALFEKLIAEGEPVVPLDQRFEEVYGTFVEDGSEKDFRKHYRGGPLSVRLSASRHMPEHRSLNLHFLVSERVQKPRMEAIAQRAAEIVAATREAPPDPEPPEPPPPPSLWARLFPRR